VQKLQLKKHLKCQEFLIRVPSFICYIFFLENESYSRRKRFPGLHNAVGHCRNAGSVHVSRGSWLLPASGDAHESRKPANGRAGSPRIQILLFPGNLYGKNKIIYYVYLCCFQSKLLNFLKKNKPYVLFFELKFSIISGQKCVGRRLVRAVQYFGPCQEEEHRRGIGPNAGWSLQEVGRYQNKIRVLGKTLN